MKENLYVRLSSSLIDTMHFPSLYTFLVVVGDSITKFCRQCPANILTMRHTRGDAFSFEISKCLRKEAKISILKMTMHFYASLSLLNMLERNWEFWIFWTLHYLQNRKYLFLQLVKSSMNNSANNRKMRKTSWNDAQDQKQSIAIRWFCICGFVLNNNPFVCQSKSVMTKGHPGLLNMFIS